MSCSNTGSDKIHLVGAQPEVFSLLFLLLLLKTYLWHLMERNAGFAGTCVDLKSSLWTWWPHLLVTSEQNCKLVTSGQNCGCHAICKSAYFVHTT